MSQTIVQVLGILQLAFVGLIAAPVDQVPAVKYLPLSWGSELIRQSMVDGVSILTMPLRDVSFLVANGLVYFGLGFLGFKLFERQARKQGLLGHY